MNKAEKKQALKNSLKYFGFDDKYIIYQCDGRLGNKFAIAEELEHGAVNNITGFMTYEEFNTWFSGFNFAKNKFKN